MRLQSRGWGLQDNVLAGRRSERRGYLTGDRDVRDRCRASGVQRVLAFLETNGRLNVLHHRNASVIVLTLKRIISR